MDCAKDGLVDEPGTAGPIGFIGVGIMGEAIILRLLDVGHRVIAWNLEPERLDTVVPFGAVAARSPAEVALACDMVMMCVLNMEAVEHCVFGADGIASAARAPSLIIDFSTADAEGTRRAAARLKEATGAGWIDAPVSGGPQLARAGTMTVMAGGSTQDFARARPILEAMAGNVTLMGPTGAGQTTKLINQAIVGAGYLVMAEALILAEAAGIDAAAVPQCLAGGFGDSAFLQRIYPIMQQRAFEPPSNYARQVLKDLKVVSAFARARALRLSVVEQSVACFSDFVAQGHAMSDSAAILDFYRQKATASDAAVGE